MRVVVYVCEVCGHAVDAYNMSPGRGCFGYGDTIHERAERVRVELPGIGCEDGAHALCSRRGCGCPCHGAPRGRWAADAAPAA